MDKGHKRQRRPPRLALTTLKVLRCLLASPEELAGIDIHRRTGVMQGTLYPMLRRLEGDGWLKGEWEPADLPRPLGPWKRKRFYRLTRAGKAGARESLGGLTG